MQRAGMLNVYSRMKENVYRWWYTVAKQNKREQVSLLFTPEIATLVNGQKVVVRLATHADIEAIAYIEETVYADDLSRWTKAAFRRDFLFNEKAFYFVLESDQEIIAFLGARLAPQDIHITNLAVSLEHRYLGCAKLLLETLESCAPQFHLNTITLEARQSNYKAIRLYQKCGYEISGHTLHYYEPDGEAAVNMHKEIAPSLPASFHSPQYRFRLLTKEDTKWGERIAELVQKNYEHPSNWSQKAFVEDMANEKSRYYVVFFEDVLCGMMSFQYVLDEATLTNVAIDQAFQKKGLATRLWSIAQKDLSQLGVRTIFLEVREFNVPARKLYEKLGFSLYHKRSDYYQQPLEDAVLYKWEAVDNEEGNQNISD